MTEGESFLKVTFHKHPMCPECLSHWGSHDETCPMKKVAKEIDGQGMIKNQREYADLRALSTVNITRPSWTDDCEKN